MGKAAIIALSSVLAFSHGQRWSPTKASMGGRDALVSLSRPPCVAVS